MLACGAKLPLPLGEGRGEGGRASRRSPHPRFAFASLPVLAPRALQHSLDERRLAGHVALAVGAVRDRQLALDALVLSRGLRMDTQVVAEQQLARPALAPERHDVELRAGSREMRPVGLREMERVAEPNQALDASLDYRKIAQPEHDVDAAPRRQPWHRRATDVLDHHLEVTHRRSDLALDLLVLRRPSRIVVPDLDRRHARPIARIPPRTTRGFGHVRLRCRAYIRVRLCTAASSPPAEPASTPVITATIPATVRNCCHRRIS